MDDPDRLDLTALASPVDHEASRSLFERRRHRRRLNRLVRTALVVVGVVAGASAGWSALQQGGAEIVRTKPADEPAIESDSFACAAELPMAITVPAAIRGPIDGPAPGGVPTDPGQVVRHWQRADGAVEARWPAPTPPVYGPRTPRASTGSMPASGGRLAVNLHDGDDAGMMFEADLIVELAAEPLEEQSFSGGCDVVELAVTTAETRWSTGVSLTSLTTSTEPEFISLEPRIVERRTVDTAPNAAVACKPPEGIRPPPNRLEGPDLSMRSSTAAGVLVEYLSDQNFLPTTGYVEMTEADGSVTFGVDEGLGWSILVFVAEDADGWYLQGSDSSGC
jgi:hypothetical protein